MVKFRERLDEFELSAAYAETLTQRIKRAFEHAESELLIVSFPSSFCTDSGRAISNVGEPPFNKSGKQAAQQAAPEWLHTLPKGAAVLYEFWKSTLQRGGFGFSARMISYPGGMPGDIGLFITWPKSGLEDKSSTS